VRRGCSAIEVMLTVAPVVVGVKELLIKRVHLHSGRVAYENVFSVRETTYAHNKQRGPEMSIVDWTKDCANRKDNFEAVDGRQQSRFARIGRPKTELRLEIRWKPRSWG
jgi:hypothetical protein